MPFTSRLEFEWGVAPRVTGMGSWDAATARVLAAKESLNEISREEIQNAMDDAMGILVEEWEAIAPVQTGRYREGISSRTVTIGPGDVIGEVYNDVPYAGFVEGGTRHGGMWGYIESRSGKKLKIPVERMSSQPDVRPSRDGRFLYTKRVRGQKAQHVLRDAHRAARPWMTRQFHLAATRAKARVKAML